MELSIAIADLRQLALADDLLGEAPELVPDLLRAARSLAVLPQRDWERWLAQKTTTLPEITPEIEARLRKWVQAGTSAELAAQMVRIPPGIFDMLRVRGLGRARVRTLWHQGGIVTLRQLQRACQRGTCARLPGFSVTLEQQLLAHLRGRPGFWLRQTALQAAALAGEQLRAVRGVCEVAAAGELRRACTTVSEIVWIVVADEPHVVLGRLAGLPGAHLSGGAPPDRVVITPADEPPQQVIVVDEAHYPARLFLETGSPAHVRAVLSRLARRDGRLAGSTESSAPQVRSAADTPRSPADTEPLWLPRSEEEIYTRAGLAWVPPELREARGEIAAALQRRLPALIAPEDLRGTFHVHSNWSDGRHSIAEIAAEARALGWEYVGIADHSQAAFYARGLDAQRIAQQADEIEGVQRAFPQLRIFQGLECDILPNGDLDIDDHTLAHLDFVIISVHMYLNMKRAAMTRRIVRAIEHPGVTILAHPLGRLLAERGPHIVDWEQVFDAAARCGVALEFNTTPNRLDLDWRLIRSATARGARICINPDAHRRDALRGTLAGVATARKGWLTAAQVLNTSSTAQLEELFRERHIP